MRLIALLLLPSLTFAAPALKQRERTDLEVTLAAESTAVLEITIKNNSKEPLTLPYRNSPLEHVAVELRGAKGGKYTVRHTSDDEAKGKANAGTLTIPAGASKTLTIHTCHYLPNVGEPGEAITFTAMLHHKGKTTVSKALTVGESEK